MSRNRVAIALATVLFLVLAGTGVASAYWSTHASVGSTVTAGVVGTAPNCSATTTLVNGSFETPAIAAGTWLRSVITGWSTGDPAGVELWNAFDGFIASNGSQFAEINGNFADTLSQVFTTTPGQTLTWSLMHRGRAGVDSMTVAFGPTAGAGVVTATFSDGNAAWGAHSGTYVVPAGQTTTKISLVAVGSAGGDLSYGNFVDDIKVDNGPCLQSTPVVTNVSRPGLPVAAGDEIKYTTTIVNKGGSNALTSSFSPVIPVGATYKPGSITVAGVARTDALADDVGFWTAGTTTVTANLGTGATAATGGTIAPGASVVVTFNAIVTSTAPSGSLSFSTVTKFADPLAPAWLITASPTTIGTPFTGGPDVAVSVFSTPAPVTGSGTTYNWVMSVTNNGPDDATGTSVLVTLPAGLTVTAVIRTTNDAGTTTANCTVTTATTRTCTIGTLDDGDTRRITVSGTVAATVSVPTLAVIATATTTTIDPVSTNNTATNTATVTDNTDPTTPGTPVFSGTTASQTTLTWTPSTDNFAVTSYDVYRNGVFLINVPTATYTNTGLTDFTVYNYSVRARDAAGNTSALSAVRYVLTMPDNSYYRISNPTGGKCIAAETTNNDAVVETANCSGTSLLQRWQFVSTGDGYYALRGQYTPLRTWDITPVGGNTTDDGRKVRASTVTTIISRQKWVPVLSTDNVTIEFVNLNSGSCLDINGSSTAVDIQMQQWECNHTGAQRFAVTDMD